MISCAGIGIRLEIPVRVKEKQQRRRVERRAIRGAGRLLVVCCSWPLALGKPVQNYDSDLSVRRLTLVCRCWVPPEKKK